MLRGAMFGVHCTVGVLLLAIAGPAAAQGQTPQAATAEHSASFTVFMQGVPLGAELMSVKSGPDGWTISSTGRLGNPVNLVTSRFEVQYDSAWKALRLDVDASLRGQPLLIHSTIANGTATTEVTQSGKISQRTDAIAPDTIVAPNLFFAAYEALALRLASAAPGTVFRTWVAPQLEIDMKVESGQDERIQTPTRTLTVRRYTIIAVNPSGPVGVEIWAEKDSGHLVRFRIASQGVEVAREDVAVVSARVERLGRDNDEKVYVPANGFSLAATVSKPPAKLQPGQRLPAVVLVAGSGPMDRDETVAGIPVFAQVAGALADAGFIVIRYDKRGVGQSGGRDEAATLADYADDVRAVVTMMSKRRDVDSKRIAVVGHSEGGMIGMLASTQDSKIAALALVATPGTTGAELVLEQQQHLLDRLKVPAEEKKSRIELQKKLQRAVLTGTGWDQTTQPFRRQADTPWFQSFLRFDPAQMLPKVKRPVLILQGELDRQVASAHAERLAALARGRKVNFGVDVFVFPGLNHLLVPARTGEVDEYASLPDKTVSKDVLDKLAWWLNDGIKQAAAAAARAK
jgi:pimeloyl-ACP methyl ester carboxylesterase